MNLLQIVIPIGVFKWSSYEFWYIVYDLEILETWTVLKSMKFPDEKCVALDMMS